MTITAKRRERIKVTIKNDSEIKTLEHSIEISSCRGTVVVKPGESHTLYVWKNNPIILVEKRSEHIKEEG